MFDLKGLGREPSGLNYAIITCQKVFSGKFCNLISKISKDSSHTHHIDGGHHHHHHGC